MTLLEKQAVDRRILKYLRISAKTMNLVYDQNNLKVAYCYSCIHEQKQEMEIYLLTV